MRAEQKLNDLNVVFFESRLEKTMGDLIRIQGGNPIPAPAMKEVALENNPAVFSFAKELFSDKGGVDVLILLTGVGVKALIAILETRYSRESILPALKKITLIPRGPKPVRVLHELGLPYALTVPEPNTWNELLSALDEHQKDIPLRGRRVFVQEYGVSNEQLLDGLKTRGAHVTRVPVYRWELPNDLEPLKQSIHQMINGAIQVAVFTTAVQAEHLLKVSRFLGVEEKLKKAFSRIVVASVGPDCTEALHSKGIRVDIQPKSPKMGPLVLETSKRSRLILEKKLSKDCASEVRETVLEIMADEDNKHEPPKYEQSAFMKACRLEMTPYTPVWLMRQAGRYMKEYRKIRDNVPFLDICKNKDLVTEITVVAQEKLKADAAIIFSDILLLVESFGLGLEYVKGDGPSIKDPVRSSKEVDRLQEFKPDQSLSFVFQAIRQTRRALDPAIPLIGFAGAPFTLASYMIEGGASKDFKETRKLMSDSALWQVLMDKIVNATALYVNAQIESGVQAIQIFDSWAGCLTGAEYVKYALPYSSKLIRLLNKGTPVIHFATGTAPFLEEFSRAGGQVISVDHHIGLEEAWRKIGSKMALQGNLDPQILCTDFENIRKHTKTLLDSVHGRAGHIFNLGHGVLPQTPVENAIALVEMVHEMSQQ